MFNVSQFLPLITQLGSYLKEAIDHYADLRKVDPEVGPEVVALYLNERMSKWDPKIRTASLLDEPTRMAAARFLAGVAVNFARA
jgi:hypothetical protein